MCNPGRSSRAIPKWQLASVPHATRSGSTRTDSQRRWPPPLCGPFLVARFSAERIFSLGCSSGDSDTLIARFSLQIVQVVQNRREACTMVLKCIGAFLPCGFPIPFPPFRDTKRYTSVALSHPHACARASNIFDPYRAATNRPERGAIPRHASLTAPFPAR
jgi:hypothetical protein